MCCGVKDDTKMPKAGSTIMNLTFLLLGFSSLFGPVTGFAMKYCKISYEIALCTCIKPKLGAVPRDIPSTVKGFDLSSNIISKIFVSDFKNLTLLVQLDLKFNQISQIEPGSFAKLISLQTLDLNGNKLVNLTEDLFEGLGNLKELRIHQNHIKEVAPQCFKPLTSLNLLDIADNKLHTLAKVHSILMHLPNLQSLCIKKNHFTTFQSWQLTNVSLALTELDLSNNEIAVFRITADVFPNLTKLVLGQSLRKEPVIWDVRGEFLRRVSALDISGLRLAFEDMKRLQERVGSSLTSLAMNGMRHNLSALVKTSCAIPTMSHLKLQDNRLTYVSSDFLFPCVNVTMLDLTRNHIDNIKDGAFRTMTALRTLILDYNRFQSVPPDLRNLPRLSELHLRYNSIGALGCHDFANLTRLRHLDLCQNSISELKECVFRDLVGLQYLTLQNNSITKLNGAFGKYLPNLVNLHLSGNKITTIKRGEFMGLKSLQNLSLHENQINVMEKGAFRGLTNVAYIRLQRNDIHTKVISDGLLSDLINLRSLELRENHISYSDSSALSDPPFSKLAHLEVLNMLSQHHSGKSMLPSNILQGLTNLLEFSTRDVQLLSLPKGIFNHTPHLKKLDISSNDLSNITSDLFYPIQGLRQLSISGVGLGSLDFLIDANLTQLEFLQSRKNKYSVISEELIKSLPALKYVDFQSNSFFCHCNNAWFIKWVKENNQTQVFDAYNFLCSYPAPLLGTKLLDFNILSCSLDTDFICFICTTCITLLFLATTFTYHFLRLQLTYAYYFYLALLFDAKTKKSPHQYDAFISYNTHDEPWVFRELVPKLEGEQGWRLCLHHRDFEPGKAIVDNITDAIYGSRKTICVISQRYLESEWCSREIQVASFRLFDEQKDVLILVFLEDIPTYHLSPYYRMRKLLKRRTYLSWTKAAVHPEVFWEKLRHALRTKEDLGEDGLVLPVDV